MKIATACLLPIVVIALVACGGGSDGTMTVDPSGDDDLDQTARFAVHIIQDVRRNHGLDSPSAVLGHIFSTAGSAELTPPHPEAEPDAAAHYHGPRPADNTGLSPRYRAEAFSEKQVVLSADDPGGRIVARGYVTGDETVVHEWVWPFD